jgi:hypothetical protein
VTIEGAITRDFPTAWGVSGAALRYELQLAEETPSNNVIKEMHFQEYRRLRQRFRYLVLEALQGKRPEAPIEQSFLVVRRHCAGLLDWDNALGGLKPLLDCLVIATKRNPSGLGLVVDDSPRSMPYPPFMEQIKAKPGKGHTEILVFEVAQGPFAHKIKAAA